MTHALAFLSGSLISATAFWLYALHIERQNHLLIFAACKSAYNKGYGDGYKDRALSGEKTGVLSKV